MASPVLSIVAPAYNEERNIHAFLAATIPVLDSIGESFELIFVDDGSRDNTLGMLAAAASQDPRIKVIGLARNFGKDIALSAGLSHATGQAVIPIDCDLQHPPGLIPAFVAKWREGYDMVLGVRSKRDEEGYVRRTLSRTYYKVMRFMTSVEIPPNAGDFRLLDRKILDVINKMPERHRFMKGIFAWPGFRVAAIEFQANLRANETHSTWSFFKLWQFALDGLFSFSTAPLKLWTYIGALSAGGAFLYLLITVIQKLFWGITVPGYASLLIVLLFFNGLLLISNGIQGEYIARIFEEVKGRPLYVVGQTFGFDGRDLLPAGSAAEGRRGSIDSNVNARAAVPTMMSSPGTSPHLAPPPPNSNATQIGIATGPQPLPTYAAPLPIPPAPLPRLKSPTAPPVVTRAPTAPPPVRRPPTAPPVELLAPPAPSTRPPTAPPSARAPSSPPVALEPTRPPTAPPIAPPQSVAPIEPGPDDATAPTPIEAAAPRPRHGLPKPTKAPPARS